METSESGRDTNNITDSLFRQLFEIYSYVSIFWYQESVDVISRLHTHISQTKKTTRECGYGSRTTHWILEPNVRITMSSVESVSNSSHKARSSKAACLSVLAPVQKKHLKTRPWRDNLPNSKQNLKETEQETRVSFNNSTFAATKVHLQVSLPVMGKRKWIEIP